MVHLSLDEYLVIIVLSHLVELSFLKTCHLWCAVSAFYAECQQKRISLDGYIWTKSKFLGLSIGVHMIGQAVISLLDYEEDYIITFPNGYGRYVFSVLNCHIVVWGLRMAVCIAERPVLLQFSHRIQV